MLHGGLEICSGGIQVVWWLQSRNLLQFIPGVQGLDQPWLLKYFEATVIDQR